MERMILTSVAWLLMLSTCHAQFNTIGRVDCKRPAKKENPSEIQDAPKDSVQTADSVFVPNVPEKNGMVGKVEPIEQKPCVSLPLKKIQINSKFGMRRHPIYRKYIMHNGVDLHARHEDVLSMLSGEVIRVGYDNRSGKYVTVQTANYIISYCHLSQQYVTQGVYVEAGTPLGLTGSTGASTGEHLHLTTKKDGKAFNPVILLDMVQSIKDRYSALHSAGG